MMAVEEVEGGVVDEVSDPKIGTIVLSNQNGSEGVAGKRKKDRRYVYKSESCTERPYYLSTTRNRMFVVDVNRIEYFPGGVEPEEIRRAMEGWPNNIGDEEVPEPEEEIEPTPVPDPKIGIIKIKVRKGGELVYDVPTEEGIITRDVFVSLQSKDKPYYLTQTGNRIYVVDTSRILLDNPPPPKKRKRPVLVWE